MDNNWFKHRYSLIKDKRIDWGTITIHYINEEIKDILEDYEVDLSDEELEDLCYEICNKSYFVKIDKEIFNYVKEKLNLE